jgi:hypothetical protein
MDDALHQAVSSASDRLDQLAASLEKLQSALTDAGFAMLDYAQPAGAAAPRSDEVLSERLRRESPR